MSGLALSPATLAMLAVGAVVFIGVVTLLLRRLQQEERYTIRVLEVQRAVGIDSIDGNGGLGGLRFMAPISALGRLIASSGALSERTLDELQQTLRVAGFRGRNALGMLVGAKLLLLLLLPVFTWSLLHFTVWSPPMAQAWPAVSGIIGLLLPDHMVRHLRKRYLKALDRGLPDALDMLVICSEAGLGLEPAIERVGNEIRAVHPAISDELMHTAQEMRVNADRRAALLNMGTRTGLETLRRLGGTLVQTMQYGTPLSDALRVLSGEMRQEALARFEARAGRLPVLLTLPMILFILPCVFLIVGGPAMVQVLQTIRK